jgi:hypothetical protein
MVADHSSRPPSTPEVFVATTVNQARLLTDPASVRYFKPFLGAEKSQTEAARELDCELAALHYRVKQLLEAGLLEVARLEKRAGRPIKRYRSVAPEIFVPFALTPYADLEESLADQIAPVWKGMISGLATTYWQAGSYGRKIYRDEKGVVWTSPATTAGNLTEQGALGAFYTDIGVPLSDEDRAYFVERLSELYREVYARAAQAEVESTDDKRLYLFQVAFVPY